MLFLLASVVIENLSGKTTNDSYKRIMLETYDEIICILVLC